MARVEQAEERLLVQYLLGNLPEEKQVEVEDRAFADRDFLMSVQAVEADLIDAYVRGELSQEERRAFERRFLASAQRRSKVEFARTLARLSDEAAAEFPEPEPRSSWVQAWIRMFTVRPLAMGMGALAALVFVATVSWLAIQNRTMQARLTALQVQNSALTRQTEVLRGQIAQQAEHPATQPKPQLAAALLASLVLLPGNSRAEAEPKQLVLEPGAQVGRIQIQLEDRDDFPRFRAELRTSAGEEVLVRSGLRPQRTAAGLEVLLDVPASALGNSRYELALKGVSQGGSPSDVGYYYFNVQKK